MGFIRLKHYLCEHLLLITCILPSVALSHTSITDEKRSHHLRNYETLLDRTSGSSLNKLFPSSSSLEHIRKETAALIKDMGEEELEHRMLATGKEGVTLTHIVKKEYDALSYSVDIIGSYCSTRDVYGDNQCHSDWGERILGNGTVSFNGTVKEGYVAEINYQVFAFGSYLVYDDTTSCPACSPTSVGSCYLGVPENSPINFTFFEVLFEPPRCPFDAEASFNITIDEVLPDESPFGVYVILQITNTLKDSLGDVMAETVISLEAR